MTDARSGQDINVLKLNSAREEPPQLQQLSWVEGEYPLQAQCMTAGNNIFLLIEGRPIGSTLIDMNFHRIVSERLSRIKIHLQGEPEAIAERMMQGRFERFKCSYGTAATTTIPTLPLAVPGLAPGHNFPDANIDDSEMIFSRHVDLPVFLGSR